MRCFVSNILVAICGGLMALTLAGCGNDSSATTKQPAAKIQGDLITPTASTPAQSKETAAAPTAIQISTPAVAQAVEIKAPVGGDGSPLVGFDKLASYNFDVPDDEPVTNKAAGPDKADDQIPSTVKAFNQKKVFIKGFMLPLKVDNGAVTEFLIL
jgi:hypothetical protein